MKRGMIMLFLVFFTAGYAVQVTPKIVTSTICLDNYYVLAWGYPDGGSDLHFVGDSYTIQLWPPQTIPFDVTLVNRGGIQ